MPPARFRPGVRVRRVDGSPVVAVRVCLDGGCQAESIPGLALVAGRMLAEGTASRDAHTIAADAEGRGMALTATAGAEIQLVAIDALAADWRLALDWAAELVYEAAFPPERVELVCRQTAAELAAIADDAETRTAYAFLDQLYRPHPRCRPLQGDPCSLALVDARVCRGFHSAVASRGAIVAITGDLDAERTRAYAEALFGGGRSPATPDAERHVRTPPRPRGRAARVRRLELDHADQAHVFAGRLTLRRHDPQLPALRLLEVILGAGSGLSGRLPQRLRERDALAYAAQVELAAGAGRERGRMAIYAGTSTEAVGPLVTAIEEELERLVHDGVTAGEVETARDYLLGQLPFRLETAGQWADLLAEGALHDLPLERSAWVRERLAAVDRAAVDAAARRWLAPSELKLTVGAPVGQGDSARGGEFSTISVEKGVEKAPE